MLGNIAEDSLAINTKSNVPGGINIGSDIRFAELEGSVVLPLNAINVFLIQTPVLSNAKRRISDTISSPEKEDDLTGSEKLTGSIAFSSSFDTILSISALHAPNRRASNNIGSILKLLIWIYVCLKIICLFIVVGCKL